MVGSKVHALLKARPFVPFELQIADGRRITITNPKSVTLLPKHLMIHDLSLEESTDANASVEFANRWLTISLGYVEVIGQADRTLEPA